MLENSKPKLAPVIINNNFYLNLSPAHHSVLNGVDDKVFLPRKPQSWRKKPATKNLIEKLVYDWDRTTNDGKNTKNHHLYSIECHRMEKKSTKIKPEANSTKNKHRMFVVNFRRYFESFLFFLLLLGNIWWLDHVVDVYWCCWCILSIFFSFAHFYISFRMKKY